MSKGSVPTLARCEVKVSAVYRHSILQGGLDNCDSPTEAMRMHRKSSSSTVQGSVSGAEFVCRPDPAANIYVDPIVTDSFSLCFHVEVHMLVASACHRQRPYLATVLRPNYQLSPNHVTYTMPQTLPIV